MATQEKLFGDKLLLAQLEQSMWKAARTLRRAVEAPDMRNGEASQNKGTDLRLRAHHVYCSQFWRIDYSDRGQEFCRVEASIEDALRQGRDVLVELVEGIDDLCEVCPYLGNGRCQSPRGNEEEVRKLDAIIQKELRWSVGTRMTAAEWQRSSRRKVPLEFCKRCKARGRCACGAPW